MIILTLLFLWFLNYVFIITPIYVIPSVRVEIWLIFLGSRCEDALLLLLARFISFNTI